MEQTNHIANCAVGFLCVCISQHWMWFTIFLSIFEATVIVKNCCRAQCSFDYRFILFCLVWVALFLFSCRFFVVAILREYGAQLAIFGNWVYISKMNVDKLKMFIHRSYEWKHSALNKSNYTSNRIAFIRTTYKRNQRRPHTKPIQRNQQ